MNLPSRVHHLIIWRRLLCPEGGESYEGHGRGESDKVALHQGREGQARRQSIRRSSTGGSLGAQDPIGHCAKIARSSCARVHRRCAGYVGGVESHASRIDPSCQELVAAVPSTSRNRVGDVVVQQTRSRRRRSARRCFSQVLQLNRVPDLRIGAEIARLCHRNRPNRSSGGGFVGGNARSHEVGNGDRGNDQNDCDHDQ